MTFSAKYLQNITNKEHNLDKLQGLEAIIMKINIY